MQLENSSAKLPLTVPELVKDMVTGTGILIVEDDEFVREAMAEILAAHRYQVFEAKTFAEAIDVFHKHYKQIALLICDVVIPGQNGCELGRLLREFSLQLKIIYVSGYTQNAIARKAELDKNSRFVPKPFSSQELVAAVNQMFQENTVRQLVRHASCTQ